MRSIWKDLSILTVATLFIAFLSWLPFYLKLPNFLGLNFSEGFATIYRNFDGLEYIIIAKTFYQKSLIPLLPQQLPSIYFASHFPLYPLLMLPFAPFIGFLKSMILVALLFTLLSATAFYVLVREFKLTDHPLFLSIIFLVLPARWLIVHSVGSAEPVFIFFTIGALYFFMKYEEAKRYQFIIWAGIFGMLAQFTRPPGILIFIALAVYVLWKIYRLQGRTLIYRLYQAILSYFPLLLIPITLFAVFYWFQISYNDFFAYFHSGDNIHLTFPPFQVFNQNQFWVGSIWLEDIIYIFILGFLGGLLLLKQKLYPLAFFVLTYLLASIFVAHRDISRYTLPIFPFILIAFEKVLVSKEFKIVLAILSLAIYLYAQNFLIVNTVSIADWTAYL